jgi:hypothetical protein
MAYAAREGRLLVAVWLGEVGFSEGVPRPVWAWTALRALAVLAVPQVVQALQQSPSTPLSLGAVTRPVHPSALHSASGRESEGVQRALASQGVLQPAQRG